MMSKQLNADIVNMNANVIITYVMDPRRLMQVIWTLSINFRINVNLLKTKNIIL